MTASPAKFIGSAPVLLVKDVVESAIYYRDTLGFDYKRFWGNPPNFVILNRDDMYLMLRQANEAKHVVPHWTVADKLWNVYFWVSDADALFEEFKKRGAKIDYGPVDQPYDVREFGIQDLDGYDIGFGQPKAIVPSDSST